MRPVLRFVLGSIERAISAVDTALMEHVWGSLAFGCVVVLLALYSHHFLVMMLIGYLLALVHLAMERRLENHPRYGAVIMALGLFVAAFLDQGFGRVLIRIGRRPINDAVFEAYRDHGWDVLIASLTVFLVFSSVEQPGLDVIAFEAKRHAIGCSAYHILVWMLR